MIYEDLMPKRIANTVVGNVTISTIDSYSGISGIRVAETMIFLDGGEMPGELNDQDGERGGLSGGQAQHNKWVNKVREAMGLV